MEAVALSSKRTNMTEAERHLTNVLRREIATCRKVSFRLYGQSNYDVFKHVRQQTRGLCQALRIVRSAFRFERPHA